MTNNRAITDSRAMANSQTIITDQNAQFMLLGSFIIAIGLVTVTVMLNDIIFEGNKAIAVGSDASKVDMTNAIQITRDEIRSAYRNSTLLEHDDAINNFNLHMRTLEYSLPTIYATHGEVVNMVWEDWSNKAYAYFTDNGTINGVSNWTVMKNVQNSTIVISIDNISNSFSIVITNTTKMWQVDFTGLGSRTISDNEINTNVASPYSIKFINGANAIGSYSITGNTAYNRSFIRARDYVLNATVTFTGNKVRVNATIPIAVPW